MSPRNRKIVILIMVKVWLFCVVSTTALADNMIVKFFQEHISPVDGPRCTLTPTCSAYAKEAIEKHGPVIGWIMTCDRLQRCGGDENHLSQPVSSGTSVRYHDPVKANDFWWFQEEKKK